MVDSALSQVGELPQSEVITQALAYLWSEVLQLAEPPAETENFFELGGDSMTMVLLEFRIKEEFSVELPAGTILSVPTLGALGAVIHGACTGAKGSIAAELIS